MAEDCKGQRQKQIALLIESVWPTTGSQLPGLAIVAAAAALVVANQGRFPTILQILAQMRVRFPVS